MQTSSYGHVCYSFSSCLRGAQGCCPSRPRDQRQVPIKTQGRKPGAHSKPRTKSRCPLKLRVRRQRAHCGPGNNRQVPTEACRGERLTWSAERASSFWPQEALRRLVSATCFCIPFSKLCTSPSLLSASALWKSLHSHTVLCVVSKEAPTLDMLLMLFGSAAQ